MRQHRHCFFVGLLFKKKILVNVGACKSACFVALADSGKVGRKVEKATFQFIEGKRLYSLLASISACCGAEFANCNNHTASLHYACCRAFKPSFEYLYGFFWDNRLVIFALDEI